MNIPSQEQCIRLLTDNNTPPNVISHCKAVSTFAVSVAEKIGKKIKVNKQLIEAAALLHDIEKMRPSHVRAGHDFLLSKGYKEVAIVVKKHGLENFDDESYHPKTTEEKIVFYADKRVRDTSIVSLDERFEYIRKKYNFPGIDKEQEYARHIEEELTQLAGEEL
jgi:putative nucleotidyltransferase with HDIG domain